jgi:hypothetical protein
LGVLGKTPYLTTKEIGMATIAAASASYAHVAAAIALASANDTVTVPAGSATWASQLVLTTGINLIGAGIGNTIITSNYSDQGWYDPLIDVKTASFMNNDPFRISGFTIDINGKYNGITVSNDSVDPIKIRNKIRIDHIRIYNSARRTIMFYGEAYGVIDNCTIESGVAFPMTAFAYNETTWSNIQYDLGSASNIYVEDCTFIISDSAFEGGAGGRYCARYNTFTFSNPSSGLQPWLDIHGNQPAANHATMGAEIYGNTVDAGNSSVNIVDVRGGKSIIFNNRANTTAYVSLGVREEYNDSLNPPTNNPAGQPQHVSDTYIWNNTKNGSTVITPGIDAIDYGGSMGPVPQANRDIWFQGASFDGTTGVGVGLLAARPATCTTGVGYWATDTSILYRAVATNTWEAYYTPYTYPHPLRGEGVPSDVMTVVSPNGGESWAGNSVHNIIWTNTGETVYANVKIEYSANSGLTWTTITASTANTGSYAWTVPNTAGAAYMIKVSAVV